MTNQLILLKLQQRLDKLGSDDYGNIEQWMYLEAFNKAQIEWIRRQLEGLNQTKTGAEATTRRIDDLQFILNEAPLIVTDNQLYWSATLPSDYLEWCRISADGVDECCPPRPLIIFERIEADRDINLMDSGKQPSFEWATTFATLSSSTVKIYTNGLFDIQGAMLTYYRVPVNIEISGIANPFTGLISTSDVLCQAADNVIEILIEDAAAILSRDIQNYNLSQLSKAAAESNT